MWILVSVLTLCLCDKFLRRLFKDRNMKKVMLTIGLTLGLCAGAGAEVSSEAFLKIGAGAEAAALGNAYTAAAEGPNAVYWNPAGIAGSDKPAATFTHTMLYDEANYDFAAFSSKGLGGNIGAAITWLSYGNLNGRDINGLPAGNFSADDMALSLAYAANLGADIKAGLAVKYIHSKIESATGDGFAMDAGIKWVMPINGLKAGFAMQNLSPEFRFSGDKRPLPLTWNAGLEYSGLNDFIFTLDSKARPEDGDDEFCFGAGYQAAKALTLRAGYNGKAAKAGKLSGSGGLKALDNLRGISAGFGASLGCFKLDYAFTPYGELGNAQRITLSAVF